MIRINAQRAFFVLRLALRLCLAGVLGLGFANASIAQSVAATVPKNAELLNSERIARKFGNYGIAVLESDATIRVSNLYSVADERRICRTFAVVHYPDQVDPLFSAEHRLILDGGSIGAVFAARGWTVEKFHRYYGEVRATNKLAELMAITPQAQLAVHVYALAVSKADARFEYATIVEIHHPDYLATDELAAIYGPVTVADSDAATAAMLEIAGQKMAR